ncbi:hypothetical protein [Pseudomonas lactis]|uniref:Uncharacterized protein n=1 Tax=Pseudomonas lactis TaxID=1615674 RepID=A0A7Y1M1M3_9PSED|nr:hypothetical protein [Pseudomonas lactis]KRP83170.1 hypothetical protein TX24_07180 [Pseudomonas lactis]NNA73491.1 hypothetical protein [Pseudomonas lactis]NNA77598.1 hypothetical protein [Pseudomonas lactis]
MAKQAVMDHWHALQAHQSDWAFRAYARLIKTLSKDVQEKLQLKEEVAEPYVVIFGKTQVGKTTLLLDLMGIDPAQLGRISQIMRGGREAGKSATATAMEYCRSANGRWGLTLRSKTHWFEAEADVTRALGQLREDMEAGQLVAESPCVVHIPSSFFASQAAEGPSIRILDLPGDNPANAAEQAHVNHMAKTYLPFADLVLLVGRGDDLGFLRPEALTLPGIEDWQAMPHRFRIVTTYSYFAQSIKDTAREDARFDASKSRRRLIQQIELFGRLSDQAQDEHLYFPLEFGTSWMSMQKNEPELHARIAPLIAGLRSELLEQISQSTSPVGRLRSTLDSHLGVRYIQKKKTEAVEQTIEQLESKNTTLVSEIAIWTAAIKKAQDKLSRALQGLQTNTLGDGIKLIEHAASSPVFTVSGSYPPREGAVKDDCETLRTLVNDYYRLLKGMRLEVKGNPRLTYWEGVRRLVNEPGLRMIEDIIDDAFSSIRYTLADYTFDTYLFSSNYQEDLRKVHSAGSEARNELVRLWKKRWLGALTVLDQEFKRDIKALETSLELQRHEQMLLIKQRERVEHETALKHGELKRIAQTSQQDLDRCERFVHLLDEEYLAELSQRMSLAMNEQDDCDALLQLLACTQLSNQRVELMRLSQDGRA